MRVLSRQRGVSLIEVLMAVLIFSIGLIGLAGLMVMATRSNHTAYLRTQATFLATNMADRMRSNPVAVWNNAYNKTLPTTATQTCDQGTPCNPAQLATHDLQMWNDQLQTFLPNPSATITCTSAQTGYTPVGTQVGMRPPYGGTCAMSITWDERGIAGDVATSGDTAPQTFNWEFQP
jgi:type IV pilus assembly protein PilV